MQLLNGLSLELLKNPFALGNNKAFAALAFCVLPLKCKLLSTGSPGRADPDVQGALAMLYKVKSKSCSSTVAGAGWRLEEQSPTVQSFSIYFRGTQNGAVFLCLSGLGFKLFPSPGILFELVQLGVRRLLMVIVGSFSSLCLKIKVFAPGLCECTRKRIIKLAKMCFT